MLLYPCKNYYDVTIANCYAPCYLYESNVMALYEQIGHGLALMFIILFFNLALIIRVIQQKRRMGRQLTWNKNRRMAIQLLSISLLFFTTNGGYFIIQLGRMLGYNSFGKSAAAWLFPLSISMPPLMSFVCLHSIQNWQMKVKRLISQCCHSNEVSPQRIAANRIQRTRHT